MTSHPAIRALRGVGWLLLPLATIGLILYFGTAAFRPQEVAAVPAPPEVSPPAPRHLVSIPLQHADGTPAADGVVLFFAPELVTARMDEQGLAHATMTGDAPLQFLAYAPGHSLLEGMREDHLDPEPLRLRLLPEPDIRDGEKLVFLPRTLTVVDEQESPIPSVLLLARESGNPGSEPWVAFTDAEGSASFLDATAKDLRIEAFTPGMPPRKSMRLASLEMPADATSARLEVQPSRLAVQGLPPQGLLSWKRVDLPQLMPMVQISDDGDVQLGPVPPGSYRLQVANRILDLDLGPGLETVNFSAAVALPQ
ncbi:MAG: hypothetical protein ACYSU1_06100 [Planctomycetota bacterium]|jgi:hypothetical protein